MIGNSDLIAVAVNYQKTNRTQLAETVYRAVLERDPQHADALYGLGIVKLTQGMALESIRLIEEAIRLKGERAHICFGLGCAFAAAGRIEEATVAFGRSVALDGSVADAHHRLGRALAEIGRAGAVSSYRRALALAPSDAEIWNHLAVGYIALGATAASESATGRALAVAPEYGFALQNRAFSLFNRNRYVAGLACLRRALVLEPATGNGHHRYAIAASAVGEQRPALNGFRRARALEPENPEIYGNYLFLINHVPGFDFARHFAENRRWGRWIEARVPPPPAFLNERNPERRLRLAYVSPELLRNHNQLSWLLPLLNHHDRGSFEIHCYGDMARPDEGTEQVKALVDVYRSIYGLAEADQARVIRADAIDIAVNLCGWLAPKRALFAWRLAPIQVAYDNHVTTAGLAAVDYRVTDAWVDPPGLADPWYTERLIRLESGYASQLAPESAPPVDGLPARRNGYVTFGSFNQLAKVTEEAVAAWADILCALPTARLLLKTTALSDTALQAHWRRRFGVYGVDPERLGFIGSLPALGDHYRALALADIALDPFPFNGGKSTCDALWMGVPVVSVEGDCQIGRIGMSLLHRAGLGELIGRDLPDYRAKAIGLAQDLPKLEGLRATLRPRLMTYGLFDGKRHTAELEAAYRRIWREWCGAG